MPYEITHRPYVYKSERRAARYLEETGDIAYRSEQTGRSALAEKSYKRGGYVIYRGLHEVERVDTAAEAVRRLKEICETGA